MHDPKRSSRGKDGVKVEKTEKVEVKEKVEKRKEKMEGNIAGGRIGS